MDTSPPVKRHKGKENQRSCSTRKYAAGTLPSLQRAKTDVNVVKRPLLGDNLSDYTFRHSQQVKCGSSVDSCP